MRTVIIVLIGSIVGLAWLWLSRRMKISRTLAMMGFMVVWLGFCGWNMAVGMSHGYSFGEEFPFLVANFVVPVVISFGMSKKIV